MSDLPAAEMRPVFSCRNPQKKYGKNKNSVYWMKKVRDGERKEERKKNEDGSVLAGQAGRKVISRRWTVRLI